MKPVLVEAPNGDQAYMPRVLLTKHNNTARSLNSPQWPVLVEVLEAKLSEVVVTPVPESELLETANKIMEKYHGTLSALSDDIPDEPA